MSKKLYRLLAFDHTPVGWIHYCPACKTGHQIYVERPNDGGAIWSFDGNEAEPTFHPSIRCFHHSKYTEDGKPAPGAVEITDCHYFLTKGILKFETDSPHTLAGQSVPLPDYPGKP